ncbi:MAG: MBL fold metallo-hydrolase, partial [bacterium]
IIEYIKVPHHGSKNGLTQKLLEAVVPKLAVISVGKNSYGHPSGETLKILRDYDTKILRTDQLGDVEVISDGEKFWVKN